MLQEGTEEEDGLIRVGEGRGGKAKEREEGEVGKGKGKKRGSRRVKG